MNGAATTVTVRANPFPGLRPFGPDEEYLFFGRDKQVDVMVDKLARTRFLAVLGGSGSGKSSLVNCGLRPALHRGLMAGAGSWRMVQFRPGSAPLKEMARALARDRALFPKSEIEGLTLEELIESTLALSKLGLIDLCEQARLEPGVNLLVVVDQFEELFRYRSLAAPQTADGYGPQQEATAFVNLLLEAARQRALPIHVVLTMRSDFLGDCAQFRGLPEAINDGQFLVPRLTREERRAAISGPVAVAGAELAPVLLTRLVNDTGDNPDQLSILQHALNRTWAKWEERGATGLVGLEHYEAIGTMAHALDQHAEEAFADLDTERKQKLGEKLFKALTDTSTDARGVRRPTKLGELCTLCGAEERELVEVINVFRDPRRSFVMPPLAEALGPASVIDISHESLMRIWNRLSRWTEEEARSAETYRKLRADAELHRRGERSLWRDPELRLALDWRTADQPTEAWASRYGAGFAESMAFLDQSAKAQRRVRVRQRFKIWGAVAAAFAAVAYLAFASWQRKEKLQRELNEFMEKNPQLGERMRHLREENRDLRLEILQLANDSQLLQATIIKRRENVQSLRQSIARLAETKQRLQQNKDKLSEEESSVTRERDALDQETEAAGKGVDDLQAENRELRKKLLAVGLLPVALRSPAAGERAIPIQQQQQQQQYPQQVQQQQQQQGRPDPVAGFTDLSLLEKKVKSLEEENRRFEMMEAELRTENTQLKTQKAGWEAKKTAAQAELDRLEKETKTLEEQQVTMGGEDKALQREIDLLLSKVSKLYREIESLAASKRALERWSRDLRADNDSMKAALARANAPRQRK